MTTTTVQPVQRLELEAEYRRRHALAGRALERIAAGVDAGDNYRTHLAALVHIRAQLGIAPTDVARWEDSIGARYAKPQAHELEVLRSMNRAAASIARGSKFALKTYRKHAARLATLQRT